MKILLTGYSGNLGPEIARHLSAHQVYALVRDLAAAPPNPAVTLLEGCLDRLPRHLTGEIEVIIHAAASTAFRAPLEELRRVNVEGTARLLEYGAACPKLRKFVHLSTACVCGRQTGVIPEAPLRAQAGFVNAYEQSKWEAEELVLASALPVEIARPSIVAGSLGDGSVRRPGALHHALYWFCKGLIPMMPGHSASPVDLISTEFAAAGLAALTMAKSLPGRIVHLAAGEQAWPLGELLETLAELFAPYSRGWASGAIAPPDLVDAHTFALFESSVRQSGDVLFQRVCADAQSFLPGLLHPRTFATSLARELRPTDRHLLLQRVLAWLQATNWGRSPQASSPRLTSSAYAQS